MNAAAPLAAILRLNERLFLNCLDGMTDDQARQTGPFGANTAIYLAVHIVECRFFLAAHTGLALEHPYKAAWAEIHSAAALTDPPPLEDLRALWRRVAEPVAAHIEALPAEILAEASGLKFPITGKDRLGTIAFLVHHEDAHIGQLGLFRRLHGLPAMKYSA